MEKSVRLSNILERAWVLLEVDIPESWIEEKGTRLEDEYGYLYTRQRIPPSLIVGYENV